MSYVLVALPADQLTSKMGEAKWYLRILQGLKNKMSKLLRKVDSKPHWEPDGEFSEYIGAGKAPADALRDLATTDNALSVWQIDDNETNLDRVLAAIASTRQFLLKIDFLICDSKPMLSQCWMMDFV